jgi:hypothetical protein
VTIFWQLQWTFHNVVGPSSVLRTEMLVPPKRLVTLYQTTRCHNPGDHTVRT